MFRNTSRHDLLTGFVAGLLNGLIGIGGGIVIVPALIARGASPLHAVGTSLASVSVLSAIAFVAHASLTDVPISGVAFTALVLAGAFGSVLGGTVLARLDARRTLLLFAVLVFALALRLTLQGLGVGGVTPVWPGDPHIAGYLGVGFGSGLLSGIFGVGGGALVVLGLAVLFAMPIHGALPIALAINVTNAVAGSLRHARSAQIEWPAIIRLIPSAILGIGVGAGIALTLDANVLRIVFGGLFCFMALRIAMQAKHQ